MGYTGEIVNDGVHEDLVALSEELIRLDKQLKDINGQTISIIVDLKGAENLTRLASLIEQQNEQYTKLNAVIAENATITQNYSSGQIKVAGNIAATTGSVKALQAELKELQGWQNAVTKGSKGWNELATQIEGVKSKINALGGATSTVNVQVNKTSNAFTVMGVNAESVLARMTVRMIAMQLIFVPIIAGITAMVELWNKVDDATQKATDRLKSYFDSYKELQNSYVDSEAKTSAAIQVQTENAERLIKDMMDKTNNTFDMRYNKYQELMSAYPKIFDQMDKEAFKVNEGNDRMQMQIRTMKDYLSLKANIATQTELNTSAITDENINIERQRAEENKIIELMKGGTQVNERDFLNKTGKQLGKSTNNEMLAYAMGLTDEKGSEPNILNSDLKNHVAYLNNLKDQSKQLINAQVNSAVELDKLEHQKTQLEGSTKDKKGRKPNAHDMDAELAAEKEHYKIRQDIIKKQYDDSRKTFVDEKQRDEEEKEAAQEHANAMILIIERWHGRVGESDAKYLARKLQVTADQMAVNNAANEDERKIALEIQKRHDQAGKAIDEEIAKLVELRNKLRELKAQDDLLKAQGKASHDYASGGMPFLEALGYSGTTEEIKAKTREIDAAQAELERKKTEHAAYNLTPGATAVGSKEFDVSEKTIDNNIDKLVLDRQKILDDKIIEAKKDIANQTIDLAKTTFESIKTIQENQFRWEQQQLDIKMQEIQLQSKQQMDAIDATTNFAIVKDNQKAKLAAQTAAQENELQKKSQELQLRQARFEKQNAEMAIIANTALAIAKTLPLFSNPITAGLGAVEVALISAIGAAQYAAASSAPLPQFEKGGTTKTALFRAGEKGAEIGITPSGKAMIFAKDSVYSAPIGTNIKTADETQKLINFAISGIGYNGSSLSAMQEKKEQAMNDKRIVEKLDEVSDNIIQAAMLGRVIKNTVVIQSNQDQQRFS